MAVFKKKIVTPQVYNANAIFEGKRKPTAVTRGRIKSTAKTANEMLEAGFKIPAPLVHKDKDGIIPKPLKDEEEGSWNSGINAGYWKGFEVDPEDGGLIGLVEIPDEEIAKKMGKTITETSWLQLPEWTDGDGKVWKDVLWHVALQDAHSVEKDQENFEPTQDQELALAMAISMADAIDETPADQGKNNAALASKVVKQLSEKLDIDLPEDTNESNILDRLLTVLTAIKHEEEEEDLTQQPEGTESPSSPIAMADNPKPDEKNDAEQALIKKKTDSILSTYLTLTKASLKEKIKGLIKKGIIGKKMAEDWSQRVDAVAMSLDDISVDDKGEVVFPELAIAMAIDAMETEGISKINPKNLDELPEDTEEGEEPNDMKNFDKPMSEEAEKEFFSNIGM